MYGYTMALFNDENETKPRTYYQTKKKWLYHFTAVPAYTNMQILPRWKIFQFIRLNRKIYDV